MEMNAATAAVRVEVVHTARRPFHSISAARLALSLYIDRARFFFFLFSFFFFLFCFLSCPQPLARQAGTYALLIHI